jgi:NAD(P)-dependent dehydrogenase (short-subunit alcohol dehydrogenase family)
MMAAGGGALLVTGNTSALRGRANFARFAPTKAAQRILAESMARDLGPQGIHVAYLVIDAVIDVPLGAGALQGRAGRFLHQAVRDRRRTLAHRPSGSLGLVIPV